MHLQEGNCESRASVRFTSGAELVRFWFVSVCVFGRRFGRPARLVLCVRLSVEGDEEEEVAGEADDPGERGVFLARARSAVWQVGQVRGCKVVPRGVVDDDEIDYKLRDLRRGD